MTGYVPSKIQGREHVMTGYLLSKIQGLGHVMTGYLLSKIQGPLACHDWIYTYEKK